MSWKHSLTENNVAQNIATTIEITAIINNSLLLCYHIYQSLRDTKTKSFTKIQCLSSITILLTIITRIGAVLSSFSLHPYFISCKLWMDILGTGYSVTKMSLYFVFLERLFTVFKISKYRFKKCFIYSSRISLFCWMYFITFLSFISGQGYYSTEYDICVANFPFWGLAIVASGDFCIIILISILFTRRLMLLTIQDQDVTINRLNETFETESNTKHRVPTSIQINKVIMESIVQDIDMLNLMKRLALLTIIALFTTLLSLIFVAIFELASLWISLDSIINCWCIVLMFKVHQKVYKFMCYKIQKCIITNGCLSCYSLNICYPIRLYASYTEYQSEDSPTLETVDTTTIDVETVTM